MTFATRNFLQSANAARLPGGLIDDTGLAANWRPKTLRTLMAAHARWLAFLALNGLLDPNLDPGDRLTPCRLRAYIKELAERSLLIVCSNRIRDLGQALRLMAPEHGFHQEERKQLAAGTVANRSRLERRLV